MRRPLRQGALPRMTAPARSSGPGHPTPGAVSRCAARTGLNVTSAAAALAASGPASAAPDSTRDSGATISPPSPAPCPAAGTRPAPARHSIPVASWPASAAPCSSSGTAAPIPAANAAVGRGADPSRASTAPASAQPSPAESRSGRDATRASTRSHGQPSPDHVAAMMTGHLTLIHPVAPRPSRDRRSLDQHQPKPTASPAAPANRPSSSATP